MKQFNQIGKRPKKDEVLNAKVGKTFVSPQNKSYSFDYEKRGNKYIYIIIYKGERMQVAESDFNKTPIDVLLTAIENHKQ